MIVVQEDEFFTGVRRFLSSLVNEIYLRVPDFFTSQLFKPLLPYLEAAQEATPGDDSHASAPDR
jgi:hypothetical protein